MGWNSWDAYGLTIDEAGFRANVQVLAGLKQYGWQYAVIDEGWYMQDPFAPKVETRKYVWDADGQLIPAVGRFPSSANGAGFKPLADWVHSLGLKFGIHIVRGIPRQVVNENLPIGSGFHAQDAADIPATCPWDEGNYGVSDTPAGQEYYDAMLKLYASWGLDYIKVDCVSDHPYRPTEIRQVAEAIRKTGRPIVLSLSPGPTALNHAAEVAKYAQMWRISDDHWDVWTAPHKPGDGEFPFGIGDAFDRLAAWAPYVKPGNWPDEDMLPEGSLTPHPGWGDPRPSRYTQDEQRTEFTLWAISRSPLIFGGNLTKLDDFTRSLMTNKELIEADQKSQASRPVQNLPAGFEHIRVWEASGGTGSHPDFCALFNLDDKPATLNFTWDQLGINGKKEARNIYGGTRSNTKGPIAITLPPHGSAIYRLE
jgi:alpha-galactosidase